MPLNNLLYDRQPRASAASELIPCMKAPEYPEDGILVLGRNPDSIVAYVVDSFPFAFHKADFDPFLRLIVVLDAVADQVLKDLADPRPIAVFNRQRTRNPNLGGTFH